MEMLTLEYAKKYTDSQRIAYTKTPTPLTFDGNSEGKEIINDNYVKVTNEVLDMNAITTVVFTDGTEKTKLTKESFEVGANDEGTMGGINYSGFGGQAIIYWCLGMDGVSDGTYVLCVGTPPKVMYISHIEFAETIHTIDPKFLPGAVLPVIEFTTAFEDGATLTDAENAALNAAFDADTPIIAKFSHSDARFVDIASLNAVHGTSGYLLTNMISYMLSIIKDGDVWTVANIDA